MQRTGVQLIIRPVDHLKQGRDISCQGTQGAAELLPLLIIQPICNNHRAEVMLRKTDSVEILLE